MISEPANLISTGVKELVDSAVRLGLSWRLRMGTITAQGATPSVLLDGDTDPVIAVTMAGNPAVDSRVYVLIIPPGGIFIIGSATWWEMGQEVVTFVTQTSFTTTVTFNRPFIQTPRVFVNINSASAEVNFWWARANTVTVNDFVLTLTKQSGLAASSWTARAVNWLAMCR